MARVFVRLKLALLANAFRRGWQQALGTVIGILYALPLALLASRGIGLLGRRSPLDTVAEPVLVIGTSLLWLGWIVGPLLAFGMDETLDPGRLRLLPLARWPLMRGLLAASTVGIGPIATLIVLYGVVIGFVPATAGAILVVAGAAAHYLLCITAARAVTTALSRRLASRRGRDVLTVAAALFGLVVAGLAQLPRFVFGGGTGPAATAELLTGIDRTAAVMSVLPGAWPARAIGAAARGDLIVSAGWLAASTATVALLLWWWAASLDRMLDGGATAAAGDRDEDLYPALVGWLPRTRLWANVAKDLRYAWRVPQLRVQYLMVALLVVPITAFTIGDRQPLMVLLSAAPLLLLGTTGFNVFGADRGAVWLLDTTGPSPAADLAAKSIVATGLALPIVAVIAAILSALTGGWQHLLPALLIAVGVQGIVSGTGLVVSVRAPFALPDSPTNVFAANAGAGCAAMLLQSLGLVVQLVLIAPVAVAMAFAVQRSIGETAVAAAAAVWGGVLWWVGLVIAKKRMSEHAPEFLAALQPRAG